MEVRITRGKGHADITLDQIDARDDVYASYGMTLDDAKALVKSLQWAINEIEQYVRVKADSEVYRDGWASTYPMESDFGQKLKIIYRGNTIPSVAREDDTLCYIGYNHLELWNPDEKWDKNQWRYVPID